ncbi:MAG: UxaA family hydrolase [Gaiellales bacterium]
MSDGFLGWERADGSVGVRNHVLILPTVVCANGVVERLEREGTRHALVTHQHGCAQVGDDLALTGRTLAGFATNPNVGAVVLLSLGCESYQPDELAELVAASGRPVEVLRIQELGGITATLDAARAAADRFRAELDRVERVAAPWSLLRLGLECGGSDSWSGITANPALGACADTLVSLGGTVVLAETPEIIGAEHLLAERAVEPAVAAQLLAAVDTWEQHAARTGVDARGAQPTPGNQAGGLTTIEEKSLGAIQKAGASPLTEVVEFGEGPSRSGFVFMDTPGHDIEQVTGFAAGGCQIVCFTTGRGTPTGCPIVPVVKIATNTRIAELMAEHVDVDAGPIATGEATIAEVGDEIWRFVQRVGTGELTAAERGGHREFALPRLWSSL